MWTIERVTQGKTLYRAEDRAWVSFADMATGYYSYDQAMSLINDDSARHPGDVFTLRERVSRIRGAAEPQPAPRTNDRPSVHDLVVQDIAARRAFGLSKYGTVLQAHNGRDALMDAYQEALDLCCYLRQAIEERN